MSTPFFPSSLRHRRNLFLSEEKREEYKWIRKRKEGLRGRALCVECEEQEETRRVDKKGPQPVLILDDCGPMMGRSGEKKGQDPENGTKEVSREWGPSREAREGRQTPRGAQAQAQRTSTYTMCRGCGWECVSRGCAAKAQKGRTGSETRRGRPERGRVVSLVWSEELSRNLVGRRLGRGRLRSSAGGCSGTKHRDELRFAHCEDTGRLGEDLRQWTV